MKCRIAGFGALSALIESAKHYFVAADSRPGKRVDIFNDP